MIPPVNPNRDNTMEAWYCKDCENTFAVVGDFGNPTFCPNCSSQNISEAQQPNNPRPPRNPDDWPYPEFLM